MYGRLLLTGADDDVELLLDDEDDGGVETDTGGDDVLLTGGEDVLLTTGVDEDDDEVAGALLTVDNVVPPPVKTATSVTFLQKRLGSFTNKTLRSAIEAMDVLHRTTENETRAGLGQITNVYCPGGSIGTRGRCRMSASHSSNPLEGCFAWSRR